ncbi:c-Myc-binding protein [Adelges cooleyi]|uniref:c-Myc-binding protein n=1 Tax=Adelges cooleyi TaxID=133065 RepID=UPI00217FADCA|nr:c-Myc-binding protein [Adelges cooleyi]XP_050439128.1 c-Myc-binding protein [Adelges cooleyi]
MASQYRPLDSRREEFQDYLERSGVLDTITKVFLMLYNEPEKPSNPIEYVRKNLYSNNPDEQEIAQLKPKIEEANAKLVKLQIARDELKALLEDTEQDSGIGNANGDGKLADGKGMLWPGEEEGTVDGEASVRYLDSD